MTFKRKRTSQINLNEFSIVKLTTTTKSKRKFKRRRGVIVKLKERRPNKQLIRKRNTVKTFFFSFAQSISSRAQLFHSRRTQTIKH